MHVIFLLECEWNDLDKWGEMVEKKKARNAGKQKKRGEGG